MKYPFGTRTRDPPASSLDPRPSTLPSAARFSSKRKVTHASGRESCSGLLGARGAGKSSGSLEGAGGRKTGIKMRAHSQTEWRDKEEEIWP
jgi:hypothetical protein